jgi:2-methylcitrate dehydratase PrpD
LLAQNGFTASESAIECAKGLAATASGECDTAAALTEPPMGWHIMSNLFKFDASCYMAHSTLAGIRWLRAQHELNTDDIAEVRLHLGDVEFATCALPSRQPDSKSSSARRTSPRWRLSAGRQWSSRTPRPATAAVIALRDKVTVTDDGTSGAPTVVEVILNDGRLLTAARDLNTPERDLALQRRRLEEKFRTITTPLLGAEDAEAVIAAVTLPAADLDVCAVSRLTRHLSSVSGAPR